MHLNSIKQNNLNQMGSSCILLTEQQSKRRKSKQDNHQHPYQMKNAKNNSFIHIDQQVFDFLSQKNKEKINKRFQYSNKINQNQNQNQYRGKLTNYVQQQGELREQVINGGILQKKTIYNEKSHQNREKDQKKQINQTKIQNNSSFYPYFNSQDDIAHQKRCYDAKNPNSNQWKSLYNILRTQYEYFQKRLFEKMNMQTYNKFSIIKQDDPDRLFYQKELKLVQKRQIDFRQIQMVRKTSKGVACFLGLAICDALGASTEFNQFNKESRILFADFQSLLQRINEGRLKPRHGRIGVWTDDCSMALCIADSLIINNYEFNPKHIRYMFHMWLYHGLNNGGREHSIGLGGNIKISMDQFFNYQTEYTQKGNQFNNGNGSLMRLAPIPICFSDSLEQCLKFSQNQSLTTHNGSEAKQCSKLLSLILFKLINSEEVNWKQVVDKACKTYAQQYYQKGAISVRFLALSSIESQECYQDQLNIYKYQFYKFNKSLKDRNWNWKDSSFNYSQTRRNMNPGYVGSYCMDALAMALHIVWYSKDFQQVALRSANMGGDCDTVGAIAGQIAGAIYGIDEKMIKLYVQMQDVKSGRFEVFLKAYKLSRHIKNGEKTPQFLDA